MSANWSRDDCLSHVADEVATGKVHFDIDCQYKLIELNVEDIMKGVIMPNRWSLQIKDGTTPTLAGLKQQIVNWRLVTCLQNEHRSELAKPRPPRWKDTTPALAAKIEIYDV